MAYRIKREDDVIRRVYTIGGIEKDKSGKTIRMVGTVQDVTGVVLSDDCADCGVLDLEQD